MKPMQIVALVPFGLFAATILLLTFDTQAQRWAGREAAYWAHTPSP
jgi:hypothetical protein